MHIGFHRLDMFEIEFEIQSGKEMRTGMRGDVKARTRTQDECGRIMTYKDAIRLFGNEDRSPAETLIALSIDYPYFGKNDLLEVFILIKQNFRSAFDRIKIALPGKNGGVSPVQNYLRAMQAAEAKGMLWQSDIIFRNIWRIMFETDEWDSEILFQPEFFEKFSAFVDGIERNLLDFWEAAAEFKDKLAEKIRTAAGL